MEAKEILTGIGRVYGPDGPKVSYYLEFYDNEDIQHEGAGFLGDLPAGIRGTFQAQQETTLYLDNGLPVRIWITDIGTDRVRFLTLGKTDWR